jgi:hypothetical protein
MTRKLALLAAVSALGLLGVPLGAEANQITFGPSTAGSISFSAVGTTQASVTITPLSGPAFFVGTGGVVGPLGTFSMGATTPSPFTVGPAVGEQYATVGTVTEPFSFSDPAGDMLTATITYSFVQDNTTNPKFFGTVAVASSSGTADFVNTFDKSTNLKFDFTTTALPLVNGLPQTLDQLVAAGRQNQAVGVSTGELVPGPIVGAGLPGLVAACGGLLALARRRRKQTA